MCVLSYTCMTFCSHDLDPTTLTYKTDLDILKVHLHTKNDVLRLRLSKVKSMNRTDTHTRMLKSCERMMLTK